MDIVISGIGMITPLGSTREQTWSNLLAGCSGIVFTGHGLEAPILGFSENGARSRTGDFALVAAQEALRHAEINSSLIETKKIGCAIGQSKPLLKSADSSTLLDPSLIMSSFSGWSAEAVVQREFGFSGPAQNIVAACATGIAAIELASSWIRSGLCDLALAGASESSLHPLYRAGFSQMGVLSEGNSPDCVRPFDANRNGFAMGEGAAILVLESKESARERGFPPLAVLRGARMKQNTSDAVRFDPQGEEIASLIRETIGSHREPDYINAHGTGTRYNDAVETKGIRLAFGAKAEKIPVSSTKAATGHLLGAAGAVEAAISILALRDGFIPPTLHLTTPDPDCDLDYVPHTARRQDLDSVLSLSFGFGGQMGAVLFGKI